MSVRRSWWGLVAALAVATLALGGCGSSGESSQPGDGSSSSEPSADDKEPGAPKVPAELAGLATACDAIAAGIETTVGAAPSEVRTGFSVVYESKDDLDATRSSCGWPYAKEDAGATPTPSTIVLQAVPSDILEAATKPWHKDSFEGPALSKECGAVDSELPEACLTEPSEDSYLPAGYTTARFVTTDGRAFQVTVTERTDSPQTVLGTEKVLKIVRAVASGAISSLKDPPTRATLRTLDTSVCVKLQPADLKEIGKHLGGTLGGKVASWNSGHPPLCRMTFSYERGESSRGSTLGIQSGIGDLDASVTSEALQAWFTDQASKLEQKPEIATLDDGSVTSCTSGEWGECSVAFLTDDGPFLIQGVPPEKTGEIPWFVDYVKTNLLN